MLNNLSPAEQVALESLLGSADNRLKNILFSMGGQETDSVFRPVRCLEDDIDPVKGKPSVNGFVYFTTDTKKIYLGVPEGKYIMMGGSSGVFYGSRQLTDDEKYGDEAFFSFTPEEIDGNAIPAMDDLILNIPDGGFYRVLQVSNTDIQTQRLVIAGGGGGNGTGNNNEGSLEIKFISDQYASTVAGEEYYIDFEIIAKDSAGDPITEPGIANVKIGSVTFTEKVYNGRNSFRVDQYLDHTIDENKITVTISMNTGGSKNTIGVKYWYIKAIYLDLAWNWAYDESNYVNSETFALQFTPYGSTDCTAHIIFDDTYDDDHYYKREITARETGSAIYSNAINTDKLGYGAHKCSIHLTAIVNGQEYSTPPIVNEVTIIRGGTGTIITVPYYNKNAEQYETVVIPFLVYNPESAKTKIIFEVNDVAIPNDADYDGHDRSLQEWPYSISTYGSLKLTIKAADNTTRKDIILTVNASDLDISEVSGYAFSLKANAFSSNSELRSWNSNGVTVSFSPNFDWINGGIKTAKNDNGDIEKFICVRQGTRMVVNYPLFGSFNETQAGGKEFKFCFKAVNCYDYDAKVLECYDPVSEIGVQYTAQQALFSSLNEKVSTQYYENSYIELETEIWPPVNDPDAEKKIFGDRFIMLWLDGVPVRAEAYDKGEIFVQGAARTQSITIGSDLCDVYVYTMKAYDRRLTEEEHLQNFIMDAPTSNEMIARYRRNDILDGQGEISYEKLVQNNPTCHAYLYEVPHMTKSKDDKDTDPELKKCKYYELFDKNNTLSNPYYQATDTQIYVQGTSSAAYGVAAFNLRSKFRKGLTDKDGNSVEKWKVSDAAIPIELACTKVNVASCENVNNVVNQEWYNKFQPYHDAHRRKTAGSRDTMEFNSGVMFIKDNNTVTTYVDDKGNPDRAKYLAANVFADTPGYVSKPYFKQYAISNMGNDKKNIDVFHDIMNPRACCVEVADNQNAEHWMTVYNPKAFTKYVDENGDKKGPFYEFRYSVEDCEADDLEGMTPEIQEQQFLDFVKWMASCDPSPYDAEKHPHGYTGEKLVDADGNDAPVTYGAKTFAGFDPPGYEGATNPSNVSLKGFTESAYAGTYTHDTKNYRIAKMLHECEDHLVMDSIVYHYLFIQRHTMVDNVAKNTFWSTEDGIHWDLTKDYDNDTSDGNDNSGYLSYTYGYEFGDRDATDGSVFNASDSVWIHFIHELKSTQQELHKKLQGIGAWDAEPYLAECLRHQKSIPERCWIYDYFRKYIRPRRLGLDEDTYLKRLEGGQKTHQRTQFEKYQEFYMNSKYVAGPIFNDSSSINLRLNSKSENWSTEHVLPISFYIDCYASAKIGGQNYVSQRLKRRQEDNLPVGRMLSAADDSTCYIYGANMMQTIKGLSNVYPNEADFNNANKLRELELGSPAEGYYNSQLTKVNISAATMLQKVQIQNAGALTDSGLGSLNLSNIKQLSDLRLDGSSFTGLTLADGSIIDNLRLNDLKSLSVANMQKLQKENIFFEDGIEDTLTSLSIINSPAFNDFSYRIAKSPKLLYYQLEKINWEITDIDDLILDENDYVKQIVALENLKDKTPLNGLSPALALSGTLTINVECKVDAFALYNEYVKLYPNLIIAYGDNVGANNITPAIELTFLTEQNSDQYHYRVLGSSVEANKKTVEFLVSSDGPTGIAMTTPSKDDTVEYTYDFTGYWIDVATGKYYYLPSDFEGKENVTHPDGAISFATFTPSANMTFYPQYNDAPRKYGVKFYNWNSELIQQILVIPATETEPEKVEYYDEWLVEYGKTYDGPMKNYHYRPDNGDLRDVERWSFQGWSRNKYGDTEIKNPVYVDLSNLVVTNTTLLYGHYLKEDCTKVPSRAEYFISLDNNTTVDLNPEYYGKLSGKITIPSKAPDGTPYRTLGASISAGFGHLTYNGVTHVFFLNDSQIKTVSTNCFKYVSTEMPAPATLREIHLPQGVETIGNGAFSSLYSLQIIDLPDSIKSIGSQVFMDLSGNGMQIRVTKLPESLVTLGSGAFSGAGEYVVLKTLPKNLETLEGWVFNNCPHVKISTFGSNDGTTSKLRVIGRGAFENAGEGEGDPVERIEVLRTVQEIGMDAFRNYGGGTLKSAAFTNTYNTTWAEMGLVGIDIEELA